MFKLFHKLIVGVIEKRFNILIILQTTCDGLIFGPKYFVRFDFPLLMQQVF